MGTKINMAEYLSSLPSGAKAEEPKKKIGLEEATEEELNEGLKPREQYKAIDCFETSLDLLAFVDEEIQNGRTLHRWQVEESEFLCLTEATKSSPLKHCLVACNGSGKDAYIIAPFAIWHALTKVRSRCIISAADFSQMKTQTESYIRLIAGRINDMFQEKVFIIKQNHIVCKWTGSEIKLFVTDEPGRAEGYHPWPDHKGSELCVIVNEGKTVKTPIYEALQRCTYNRFIVVSSPGQTSGYLYDKYQISEHFPCAYVKGKWYSRRVSYLDCPHIPVERVQQDLDEVGEDSIWFRSRYKAEFTNIDETTVLTSEDVHACQRAEVQKCAIGRGLRAGLDLSSSHTGDEIALYVYDDNKFVGKETFRSSKMESAADMLVTHFDKYGFTKEEAWRITADHGGIGAGFAALFRDRGWEIAWCTNNHKPSRPALYMNKGTENWYTVAKLIQRCLIELPKDDKLLTQLSNRYVVYNEERAKVRLESKPDAKAAGRPSPDRADALVLCWMGVSYQDFEGFKPVKTDVKIGTATNSRIIKHMEDRKYSSYDSELKKFMAGEHLKQSGQKTKQLAKSGFQAAYRKLLSN